MKVFIRCLVAVGMEFYGGELPLGEPLHLVHEPDNKYDSNAIALLDQSGKKVAYLCKSDAKCIANVIKRGLATSRIIAKAKYKAEIRSRKGPQQRVGIGFFANSEKTKLKSKICCCYQGQLWSLNEHFHVL